MEAGKVFITPGADGKLLLGKNHLELADATRRAFTTDNLEAFQKFVGAYHDGCEVFFTDRAAHLVRQAPKMGDGPVATLNVRTPPALQLIIDNANKELSIQPFEIFLTSLRRFATSSHMALISRLRNFAVSKQTTYERNVDNAGNFLMSIKREGGNQDWTPPETLSFKVPLFPHIEEMIELSFDLIFTIKDGGEPRFHMQSLTLADDLQQARLAVLGARLAAASTAPVYWGEHALIERTDAWRFKEQDVKL
jgi:hypothetical protein